MGFLPLLVLLIAAVLVAYFLGTYLQRLDHSESSAARTILRRLARPAPDRKTEAVVRWLLSQAFEQTGVRVADDELAYGRIVEAAAKAVEHLKEQEEASISLPFLTADETGPKHFETQVTRKLLEELVRD